MVNLSLQAGMPLPQKLRTVIYMMQIIKGMRIAVQETTLIDEKFLSRRL